MYWIVCVYDFIVFLFIGWWRIVKVVVVSSVVYVIGSG